MIEKIERVTCDKCGKVDVPGTQTVDILLNTEMHNGLLKTKCAVADMCPPCLAYSFMQAASMCDVYRNCGITWREELR